MSIKFNYFNGSGGSVDLTGIVSGVSFQEDGTHNDFPLYLKHFHLSTDFTVKYKDYDEDNDYPEESKPMWEETP